MAEDILVVDDEQDIRDSLQLMLEFEGYRVRSSEDGDIVEDMSNWDNTYPKLIILDVMLRGKDGRDLVRKLKSVSKTRKIPVLMISAFQNVRGDVVRSGADDFLAKPFDYYQLLGKVKKYVN